MNKIVASFFKGLLLGVVLLPLEFIMLLKTQPVLAQDSTLTDQIRSQVTDPRDIRSVVPDPRDTVTKPCEVDPREGCAREIPRGSASSQPQPSSVPSAAPSITPSTGPQASPSPAVSAAPSPSSGVGGPAASQSPACSDCGGTTNNSTTNESTTNNYYNYSVGGTPQVLGLSFTGSGKW